MGPRGPELAPGSAPAAGDAQSPQGGVHAGAQLSTAGPQPLLGSQEGSGGGPSVHGGTSSGRHEASGSSGADTNPEDHLALYVGGGAVVVMMCIGVLAYCEHRRKVRREAALDMGTAELMYAGEGGEMYDAP